MAKIVKIQSEYMTFSLVSVLHSFSVKLMMVATHCNFTVHFSSTWDDE